MSSKQHIALTDVQKVTLAHVSSMLRAQGFDSYARTVQSVVEPNALQRHAADVAEVAPIESSSIEVHADDVIACVAGVTLFGPADSVAVARSALEAKPMPVYPDELTPDLCEALGRPNFACAPLADIMRAAGTKIRNRSEDEQAHVLHWMVKLVLRHGAEWREEGSKNINAWLEVARAKAES